MDSLIQRALTFARGTDELVELVIVSLVDHFIMFQAHQDMDCVAIAVRSFRFIKGAATRTCRS